jgi:hypothetical protein
MAKQNWSSDGRKICSLCHKVCGSSQRDLRLLPTGEVVEEGCLSEKIFQEIVKPIKIHIPYINHPPLRSSPERLIDGLVKELLAQPLTPFIQDSLGKIMEFSQLFLRKEIVLSGPLR